MSGALEVTGAATAPVSQAVDPAVHGSAGPWRTALGQLVRNKGAMVSLALLVLILVACLCAPLYASSVAHVDPFTSNVSGTTVVDGVTTPLLEPSSTGLGLGVTPIGPTWDPTRYFLGVDNQGRDVFARLLYGGRNSLLIGVASALICCTIATALGLLAGYVGGWVDSLVMRLVDHVLKAPLAQGDAA